MRYIKGRHDVGFLRQDKSTTIGFMLALAKSVPAYAVYDDEYLAQQFFTGTPGYASLPAEKEIADRQDDWRSGFGKKIYSATDTKRYHKAVGMDMRHEDMAISSWGVNNIGDIPKEIRYSSFQVNCNTVQWINKDSAADSSISTTAQRGAGSGAVAAPIYFTPAVNVNCEEITLFANRTNAAVNSLSVAVYNIDAPAWEQVVTQLPMHQGGTWHTFKFGPCNVSNVNVDLQSSAPHGFIAYLNEVQLKAYAMNGSGDISAHAKFNDEEYFACNTVLAKLNAGGTALTPIRSYENRITALEPDQEGRLMIAFTTNVYSSYKYVNSNGAILTPDYTIDHNHSFEFSKMIHTSSPTMYGSDGVRTIRSATDISNANSWSTQTNVGSPLYNITSLLSKAGALYMMKEDKPYYLDSTGAVQDDLVPELENDTSPESGKYAYVWENKPYINAGTQTIVEVDGTTITYLNPADYCTDLPDFSGRIDGIASMDRWLFILLRNETDNRNIIVAGRRETIGGSTSWVWHPQEAISMANTQGIFTSDIYQKRLYITTTNTSEPLRYLPLPKGYGNLPEDDNRDFKSGGYFWTPYMHGNFKGDSKAYYKLITTLGHAYNSNRYFEAHYRTLENTAWTKIGDAKGTEQTMLNTLYIPLDGAEEEPVTTMIQLNFCANTDDSLETPILLDYDIRSILRPPKRNIIVCTVRVSDDIMDAGGSINGQAGEFIEALDEARAAKWPVTFFDIRGEKKTVTFLPLPSGTPRYYPVKDEKDKHIEWHYNLMLQEVVLA